MRKFADIHLHIYATNLCICKQNYTGKLWICASILPLARLEVRQKVPRTFVKLRSGHQSCVFGKVLRNGELARLRGTQLHSDPYLSKSMEVIRAHQGIQLRMAADVHGTSEICKSMYIYIYMSFRMCFFQWEMHISKYICIYIYNSLVSYILWPRMASRK